MCLCQKGAKQLKIYVHWILLISTTLFLKAFVRRRRADRYKVDYGGIMHPANRLESRLES